MSDELIEFAVEPPNYTQTPNELFDAVLPEITSLAELKVTLAILRRTFGWRDQAGPRVISLSELQTMTGLSRQSCQEGAVKAHRRGFVGRRRDEKTGSFLYGLRVKKVGTVQATRPATGLDACTPPNKERKNRKKNNTVDELDDRIQKAFDYWLTIIGAGVEANRYKLTKERRRALKQRLEDSQPDEIRDAMLGGWHDTWCQETGKWDIAYVLRTRTLCEEFRDRRSKQVGTNGHASRNPQYDTTVRNPELEPA